MKSLRNEEGSALVEFGLSSAVLFMTLFGLMACCTALYSYIFVSEAAREASRYAIEEVSAKEPDPQSSAFYAERYEIYRLLYPALRPVYERISELDT